MYAGEEVGSSQEVLGIDQQEDGPRLRIPPTFFIQES